MNLMFFENSKTLTELLAYILDLFLEGSNVSSLVLKSRTPEFLSELR